MSITTCDYRTVYYNCHVHDVVLNKHKRYHTPLEHRQAAFVGLKPVCG